ncbi:hypothetical protein O9992_16270 [Vibrio lentus]|nr:hypothetical protein [Vibrio lentus]
MGEDGVEKTPAWAEGDHGQYLQKQRSYLQISLVRTAPSALMAG